MEDFDMFEQYGFFLLPIFKQFAFSYLSGLNVATMDSMAVLS